MSAARSKWAKADNNGSTTRSISTFNSSSMAPSGPSYSMGCKLTPKRNETWQRGPGSYDATYDTKARGPSFSLGVRETAKTARSSGPGPGSYNLESSSFTKTSAPSFSMGGRSSSTSSSSTHNSSPGPGAYNLVKDTQSGGTFSSYRTTTGGDHHQQQHAGSTGYNSSSFGRSTITASAPSFSFGSARPIAPVDRTPGPGSYNCRTPFAGPAYSINSRKSKLLAKDVNPGSAAAAAAAYQEGAAGKRASSFTVSERS